MQFSNYWRPYRSDLRLGVLLILAVIVVAPLSYIWLRMPPSGLIASYYPNPDWQGPPAFAQTEKEIGLTTFYQLVANGQLPAEQSSVAWNGWINIPVEGEYRFYTTSDDGSSIMIDEQLVSVLTDA